MAISKTTVEDFCKLIAAFDKKFAETKDETKAMEFAAKELDISVKTVKERYDALRTTLDVWDAFEDDRLSYTKFKELSLSKFKGRAEAVNFVLKKTLADNLAPKDISTLKQQILKGEVKIDN
ncbi:MAG: hypothetical protein NUW37_01145 [Planctomycetes bacterium]|nr:hypothetical protein [Planctomycetota bacterium]